MRVMAAGAFNSAADRGCRMVGSQLANRARDDGRPGCEYGYFKYWRCIEIQPPKSSGKFKIWTHVLLWLMSLMRDMSRDSALGSRFREFGLFIGTRPSTIDITTRGNTWRGDGPDTGRCDDPAAATGHYRLEEACDWSIAHGATTQLTDHIVCFLPDPTRAGRGAAEIGQARPHTPVEIGRESWSAQQDSADDLCDWQI